MKLSPLLPLGGLATVGVLLLLTRKSSGAVKPSSAVAPPPSTSPLPTSPPATVESWKVERGERYRWSAYIVGDPLSSDEVDYVTGRIESIGATVLSAETVTVDGGQHTAFVWDGDAPGTKTLHYGETDEIGSGKVLKFIGIQPL